MYCTCNYKIRWTTNFIVCVDEWVNEYGYFRQKAIDYVQFLCIEMTVFLKFSAFYHTQWFSIIFVWFAFGETIRSNLTVRVKYVKCIWLPSPKVYQLSESLHSTSQLRLVGSLIAVVIASLHVFAHQRVANLFLRCYCLCVISIQHLLSCLSFAVISWQIDSYASGSIAEFTSNISHCISSLVTVVFLLIAIYFHCIFHCFKRLSCLL